MSLTALFDAIRVVVTAAISCQHRCISDTVYHVPDKPGVSLSLGRNIEMNKIKEGEDIYLECLVSSRPPPTKLYFKHQVSPAQWPFSFLVNKKERFCPSFIG